MSNKNIRIKLKSFDHRSIDKSAKEIVDTAKKTGANVQGPIPLPSNESSWTVIKSPHVNKKSRDQYGLKSHKRLIDVLNPTDKTVDALTKLELAAGIYISLKLY